MLEMIVPVVAHHRIPITTNFSGYNHVIASVDKGIHNKTTKYGLPTY